MFRGPGAALAVIALSGCSLILDFDVDADAGPGDAGLVDAGGDGPDPCETGEPNDDISEAFSISAGTHSDLAICPAGDKDFYRFSLGDAQDLIIVLSFDNMGGAGDLEMRLYDGQGNIVDGSMGFGNTERIERSLAMSNQLPAGDYSIEIYAFSASTQNTYTLELAITTP
jgi:hypothetical protein